MPWLKALMQDHCAEQDGAVVISSATQFFWPAHDFNLPRQTPIGSRLGVDPLRVQVFVATSLTWLTARSAPATDCFHSTILS